MNYVLIDARQEHVSDIAYVFRRSREKLLTFLPELHSFEEDKEYFAREVWPHCEIFIAQDKDKVVGFIAFQENHISHFYLLPEYVGYGIGKSLLDKVKGSVDRLELWVFKDNKRAISFYESNGFRVVRETDGQKNEEKLPDLFMVWGKDS